MKKHGDRQSDLAKYIDISPQRFSAKINEKDGAEFTKGEIGRIKKKYNLSAKRVDEIFFADYVSSQDID